MTQKNRNRVITRLDAVLETIVPFNKAYKYSLKLHLLNEITDALDNVYGKDLTDERIDFIIGTIIYGRIMTSE